MVLILSQPPLNFKTTNATTHSLTMAEEQHRRLVRYIQSNTFETDLSDISPLEDTKAIMSDTVTGIPDEKLGTDPQRHVTGKMAREPQAWSTIWQSIGELCFAVGPLCFLVFGCIVYSRREQPLNQNGNSHLLKAAQYVCSTGDTFTSMC
jgi:hypothetical protein